MTTVWFAPSMVAMEQPGQSLGSDPDLSAGGHGLSERDAAILEYERQWWKFPGAKEEVIRERFSISATSYYQILNHLIDTREALEADPLLVKRLQRLRAERMRARSARRLNPRTPDDAV